MNDIRICVIYHSGLGHTAYQAKAVRDGAGSVAGASAELIYAGEAMDRREELQACDGMIFGCPTYMGSASAGLKEFMDATSRIWLAQGWKNKVAGGFTNSGNQSGDKLSTLYQLMTFAMQHGMIWAGLDLPGGNNSSRGGVEDLNRLGSWVGAMAQSNTDQGIDGLVESDLRTAYRLGARVAEVAAALNSPVTMPHSKSSPF
ncbi:MAG: flavodoxin family protein [Pseudomonadota bacterium]